VTDPIIEAVPPTGPGPANEAASTAASGKGGLFHHRDFRRLWIGDAVSQIGSQVSMLALPLVAVKTLHATAFEVGVLAACETAAFLLVGLPAGALCDRVRRRPILIGGDIGRALALGSVPIAALMHRLTIGQMFVVALVTGVLTVFFDVGYQSYLPELVDNDQLIDGNAKLEATRAVAQIGGPSLGGFLVQVFTAPYAVAVDAVSFLWSAGWVTSIRAREPQPARPEHRSLRKEMAEGLRFVLSNRILRKIAGCTGTFNLASSALFAVEILFLVRSVHLSAAGIGVLMSIGSIGSLLTAVTISRIIKRLGQARAIWIGALISAPGSLAVPITHHDWRLALTAVGMFINGIGVVVYNVAQVSFRQGITPRPLLGRMNATMRFLVWGTMPLGALLGGWLATVFGLRHALWIAAGAEALAPLWVILSPLLRMRDLPSAPPEDSDVPAP
jgi:MFS family permease